MQKYTGHTTVSKSNINKEQVTTEETNVISLS